MSKNPNLKGDESLAVLWYYLLKDDPEVIAVNKAFKTEYLKAKERGFTIVDKNKYDEEDQEVIKLILQDNSL